MKRRFKYPWMDIELLEDWDILCKSQDGWGDYSGSDDEGEDAIDDGGGDTGEISI